MNKRVDAYGRAYAGRTAFVPPCELGSDEICFSWIKANVQAWS